MKNFINRLIIFTIPVLLFLTLIAFYNYWLDPFGVIKGNMTLQKTEPNQRFLKMKHILYNPEKYDSFLFGTSRVGKIDVSVIPDDNNWYNYTYSQAIPFEILTDIKMLLNNNIIISKIMIGLDDMSYLVSPESHKNEILRKPYQYKDFPLGYVFLKPSLSMFNKIKHADTSRFFSPGYYETLYRTGSFLENKKDKYIESHEQVHKNDPVFKVPYWERHFYERIKPTIGEIYEIIKVCKENNIELTFFINPLHICTYMNLPKEDYFSFIEELSKLTSFIDFSGINDITINNYNYYETSHFRPFIGNKMIDVIFNNETHKQPFGRRVGANNINSIINQKKNEIRDYEMKSEIMK